MVLQELLRQPRQVPAYGFLQGLAFAVAGGTDAADDVGPERALAVDCRRRRQDFSIRTVYQSCGQRRGPDINSQAIVVVRCQRKGSLVSGFGSQGRKALLFLHGNGNFDRFPGYGLAGQAPALGQLRFWKRCACLPV